MIVHNDQQDLSIFLRDAWNGGKCYVVDVMGGRFRLGGRGPDEEKTLLRQEPLKPRGRFLIHPSTHICVKFRARSIAFYVEHDFRLRRIEPGSVLYSGRVGFVQAKKGRFVPLGVGCHCYSQLLSSILYLM